LADELAAVGKLEEAADRLAQVEARFADSPAFQHRLAVALVMANRRDQGVARYRRACELDPENAIVLVELAMLLLDRRADGDLVDARTFADRAHALAPNAIQVRLCRAELFALANQTAEAATLYRSIAADLPDNSELKQTCLLRAEWLER
jgi:predicted Zn-dependent protease